MEKHAPLCATLDLFACSIASLPFYRVCVCIFVRARALAAAAAVVLFVFVVGRAGAQESERKNTRAHTKNDEVCTQLRLLSRHLRFFTLVARAYGTQSQDEDKTRRRRRASERANHASVTQKYTRISSYNPKHRTTKKETNRKAQERRQKRTSALRDARPETVPLFGGRKKTPSKKNAMRSKTPRRSFDSRPNDVESG